MITQTTQLTKEMVEMAMLDGTLDAIYGQEVHRLVRLEYSQSQAEAIISNYLADPQNENYKAEMLKFQEYREWCKNTARETIDRLKEA